MTFIGPNTLGTLVVLVAAVSLGLVTISSPIQPQIHFLAANVKSSVSTANTAGVIKMGVFGYCISTPEEEDICSPLTIGYVLDPNVLLRLPKADMLKLSDSVIKGLTSVLVLHAIAAALAALAFLSGLVSHIQEFSRTCWTSCLASLAASATLLALIFDFVLFSIVRSRINAVGESANSSSPSATFGNAIWLTLVAWVCLAFSGFFFCAGRCLCSTRRSRRQRDASQFEPIVEEKGKH